MLGCTHLKIDRLVKKLPLTVSIALSNYLTKYLRTFFYFQIWVMLLIAIISNYTTWKQLIFKSIYQKIEGKNNILLSVFPTLLTTIFKKEPEPWRMSYQPDLWYLDSLVVQMKWISIRRPKCVKIKLQMFNINHGKNINTRFVKK